MVLKRILLRALISLLIVSLSLTALPAIPANHEPLYKAGMDTLNPGQWEAHFVWLRSPHFNFLGEVWWRFLVVDGPGTVDVLFLDWEGFQAFREMEPFEPLAEPLSGVNRGYGWKSGLNSDLPYFLLIQNPGRARVFVVWAVFAELDWRRWQGQAPGPTLDVVPVSDSPELLIDHLWSMKFEEAGFYVVHTRPHLDTTGLIEVTPSVAPGPPVDVQIQYTGFHPEVIQIPAGTVVRWTNLDEAESTVHVGILPEGLPSRAPHRPMDLWFLVPASLAAIAVIALHSLFRGTMPSGNWEHQPGIQDRRIKHK